ncbi:MAG: hypothetical protein QOH93_1513 [Chloroflexia bacterium]|jgi:hypothetical protein|nr:hypothetical protein [Chloroflexia bacterium]
MAKKGSRPNKANQQRAREEQWRRRAAAQTGGATSVVDDYAAPGQDGADFDGQAEFTTAEMPANSTAATSRSTATPRATTTRTTTPTATSSAAQRRATNLARTSRARYTPNVMSIEDEMYYVRSDIRRLILLTVACIAVLVVLYFLIAK